MRSFIVYSLIKRTFALFNLLLTSLIFSIHIIFTCRWSNAVIQLDLTLFNYDREVALLVTLKSLSVLFAIWRQLHSTDDRTTGTFPASSLNHWSYTGAASCFTTKPGHYKTRQNLGRESDFWSQRNPNIIFCTYANMITLVLAWR